ncbi:MAG TPA: sigma-54 dependent transcriptional regulator [Polyangiaceae bacterium]|nr:sigma-54 dependent transcriptional regulator [Polyangiaceae bacterium]
MREVSSEELEPLGWGQPSVLVIDDEPAIAGLLSRWLKEAGWSTEQAPGAIEGLARLERRPAPDVVLVDLHMPGLDGLSFIERAHSNVPELPIIVMTARASVETAVAAMRQGAFDFLTKPFEPPELVTAACRRALSHIKLLHQNRELKQQLGSYASTGLVGSSAPMDRLRRLIDAVAPTEATVLIAGETGTGKELVARAVHAGSERRANPFIAVNCGALSETLLESELFGHVRGAFTGATSARRGLIEAASGGTLFLDEVGELSLAMQTRLLRVLQEGEVRPVGADSSRIVDVRVVAATHRDLAQSVKNGSFREDLYYRLNVFRLDVAPLRARREDIPALTRHFLERLATRLGRKTPEIEADAVAFLCDRPWRGNLRQLENTLERALILSRGDIGRDLVETVIDLESEASPVPRVSKQLPLGEARQAFEHDYLRDLLTQSSGSRAEAARRAGLDPSNLRRLLKRHGLD